MICNPSADLHRSFTAFDNSGDNRNYITVFEKEALNRITTTHPLGWMRGRFALRFRTDLRLRVILCQLFTLPTLQWHSLSGIEYALHSRVVWRASTDDRCAWTFCRTHRKRTSFRRCACAYDAKAHRSVRSVSHSSATYRWMDARRCVHVDELSGG